MNEKITKEDVDIYLNQIEDIVKDIKFLVYDLKYAAITNETIRIIKNRLNQQRINLKNLTAKFAIPEIEIEQWASPSK